MAESCKEMDLRFEQGVNKEIGGSARSKETINDPPLAQTELLKIHPRVGRVKERQESRSNPCSNRNIFLWSSCSVHIMFLLNG